MAEKATYSISAEGKKARINIVGPIGAYNEATGAIDNGSVEFTAQVDALLESGVCDFDLYINSIGGDLFAGNEIYNQLMRFTGHKTCEIGAVCASAATIIAMSVPAEQTSIASNGLYMIHNAAITARGSARELESALSLFNIITAQVKDLYAQRSKLSIEEVGALMDNTTWLNAKQAVAKGFVGKVLGKISEAVSAEQVAMLASYGNVPAPLIELLAVYAKNNPEAQGVPAESKGKPTDNIMNLKELALKMGLPETALEGDILQGIGNLVSTNASLAAENASLKAEKQAAELQAQAVKVTALVDGAIAARKILAGQKADFVKLAASDYETTKKLLDGMPSSESVEQTLNAQKPKVNEAWANMSWDELDQKNLINKVKMEDPGLFEMKYQEAFGKPYKG